jgi:hypothetical protein
MVIGENREQVITLLLKTDNGYKILLSDAEKAAAADFQKNWAGGF